MNRFCKRFFGVLFAVIVALMLLLTAGLARHLSTFDDAGSYSCADSAAIVLTLMCSELQ